MNSFWRVLRSTPKIIRFALILSVALILVVVCTSSSARGVEGCLPNATYAGPPERNVPSHVWNSNDRESISGDLNPDLQRAMEHTLDEFVTHVPAASVAVAIPGEGLWHENRGFSSLTPPRSVTERDLFQAASITKAFTAVITLQLVNDNRLNLNDALANWFPTMPNAEVMTIEHLLRHMSGLMSFNAIPSVNEEYRTPEDVSQLAVAEEPLFCPGTNWAYTNTGYVLLGRIIEAIEGMPFQDVLARRITIPLTLNHTMLRQVDVDAPVVTGHTSGHPVEPQDGYATRYTSGAIASTASDLVHFWYALLTGDLMPNPVVQQMFSEMPAMSHDQQFHYGMGVQMYDVPDGPGLMLGHSGGIVGFTSVLPI